MSYKKISANGFGEELLYLLDGLQSPDGTLHINPKNEPAVREMLDAYEAPHLHGLMAHGFGFLHQIEQAHLAIEDLGIIDSGDDEPSWKSVAFNHHFERPPVDRIISNGRTQLDNVIGSIMNHFLIRRIQHVTSLSLALMEFIMLKQEDGARFTLSNGDDLLMENVLADTIGEELVPSHDPDWKERWSRFKNHLRLKWMGVA